MKRRYLNLLLSYIVVLILLAGAVWNHNKHLINNQNPPKYYVGAPTTSTNYTWPAEFEKQEAIWMQWPSEVYTEGSNPVTPAMINIIKAFDPYIRVNVAARSTDEIVRIKNLLKSTGYTGKNAHFYVFNHLSIWTRDVGPIFVRDRQSKLNVVDFGFNNYSRSGNQYYIDVEKNVDRLIASFFGLPIIKTNLISEGGAIESNGRGTMMSTEAVALKRNPQMSRQQIENEYKRVLGLKKVIWFKKGLAEDESITTGHINEYCRFVSPNTVLLAQVLPIDKNANYFSQESYKRMEENYNLLKNSTDQDGKPFKIIRVPIPPTLYNVKDSSGTLPVRSYLNFAVTNGAVLMQTYWKPGRSEALKATEDGVKEILKGVFPGRKIIEIDAESINRWGGGIHCITQHMPAE